MRGLGGSIDLFAKSQIVRLDDVTTGSYDTSVIDKQGVQEESVEALNLLKKTEPRLPRLLRIKTTSRRRRSRRSWTMFSVAGKSIASPCSLGAAPHDSGWVPR